MAYGGLYLMVATMGAGGDLAAIAEAPLVLAVGVVWISIHVTCLFLAMRLLRAPVFLFATGSMGNVGGVISTPVVAGVFQPALAAVAARGMVHRRRMQHKRSAQYGKRDECVPPSHRP